MDQRVGFRGKEKKKKCYFLKRLVLELKLLVSSYTCVCMNIVFVILSVHYLYFFPFSTVFYWAHRNGVCYTWCEGLLK